MKIVKNVERNKNSEELARKIIFFDEPLLKCGFVTSLIICVFIAYTFTLIAIIKI